MQHEPHPLILEAGELDNGHDAQHTFHPPCHSYIEEMSIDR